jgi:putative transposase
MMVSFKGAHFVKNIILTCVRWYVAYPLSDRQGEELMQEGRVPVDHATINRWVLKYSPQLKEVFHRRKPSVWISWRMDATSIKVRGPWRYLYRAGDKSGQIIDFLLTEPRDERAAKRFLIKAIHRHGVPETITINGSEANAAAITGYKGYNEAHGTVIVIRQVKYLNNMVEQDHRGVKRVTRPMPGFKSFDAAQCTLTGVELMQMLRKSQLAAGVEQGQTPAEQSYSLAA